jgi:hypothetical protein
VEMCCGIVHIPVVPAFHNDLCCQGRHFFPDSMAIRLDQYGSLWVPAYGCVGGGTRAWGERISLVYPFRNGFRRLAINAWAVHTESIPISHISANWCVSITDLQLFV